MCLIIICDRNYSSNIQYPIKKNRLINIYNIGKYDVRTFLSILFSPLGTEPVLGGTVGRAAVGGLRILDRCNMSVRSDEAHVHPTDRTDRSIDGNTAT